MTDLPPSVSALPSQFGPLSDFCILPPSGDTLATRSDTLPLGAEFNPPPIAAAAIPTAHVPTSLTFFPIALDPERINGATTNAFTHSWQPAKYFLIKSRIDRCLAAAIAIIALPVLLLVSVAVLLLQGRPMFYRQDRVGKGGRVFRIWKFRTMHTDAERLSGAVWSIAGDPRVTRLGRLLRCTHIDELPQLLNVLKGDMDLVGPRPERPEFVSELCEELPYYSQRLAVKPGITGLAQLKLGYDVSVADIEKKVLLDLQYIRQTSFRNDLSLLLQTIPYIACQLWHQWRAIHAARSAASALTAKNCASKHTLVQPMVEARQLRRSRLDAAGADCPNATHRVGVPSSSSALLDHL